MTQAIDTASRLYVDAEPDTVPCAWCDQTIAWHMSQPHHYQGQIFGSPWCADMACRHPGMTGCLDCGQPLDDARPCAHLRTTRGRDRGRGRLPLPSILEGGVMSQLGPIALAYGGGFATAALFAYLAYSNKITAAEKKRRASARAARDAVWGRRRAEAELAAQRPFRTRRPVGSAPTAEQAALTPATLQAFDQIAAALRGDDAVPTEGTPLFDLVKSMLGVPREHPVVAFKAANGKRKKGRNGAGVTR